MSHSANYRDTGPTTIYYQGLHEGIRQEQERIIKLLEDDGYMIESDKNHAIALIKGQNNV